MCGGVYVLACVCMLTCVHACVCACIFTLEGTTVFNSHTGVASVYVCMYDYWSASQRCVLQQTGACVCVCSVYVALHPPFYPLYLTK